MTMQTKKTIMIVQVLTVAAFISLGFNNCSGFKGLQAVGLSSSASKTETDNGVPYDGKLGGYLRYIPNYACGGNLTPVQVAIPNDNGVQLYSYNGDQCGTQGAPLAASDIQYSPFEKDFIVINDALFEKYTEITPGIPNNLAELLCRDNFENPSFEITAHYDNAKNAATTRVYTADSTGADLNVNRLISTESVHYVSDEMNLLIDISKSNSSSKKYKGEVTFKAATKKTVTCVVGGALDTSNWLIKQISTHDITYGFYHMPNGTLMLNSPWQWSGTGPRIYSHWIHLFAVRLDGNATDLNSEYFPDYSNFQNYTPMSDPDYYLFTNDNGTQTFPSAYIYNTRTSKIQRVTNLNLDPKLGNNQDLDFYLAANAEVLAGNHLVYAVNRGRTMTPKLILRDMNLDTGHLQDLAENTIYQFLKSSNEVVFITGLAENTTPSQKFVLQKYNVVSQTTQKIEVSTAGCTEPTSLELVNDNKTALITTYCANPLSTQVYAVSLTDGISKLVGDKKGINWISKDRKWALLANSLLQSGDSLIYNIETEKSVTTSSYFLTVTNMNEPNPISVTGDRWVYGLTGDTNNPKLTQVDITTGATSEICSTVSGKIYVGSLPASKIEPEKAFLFSYDTALQIYHFDRIEAGGCSRLNEFPSSNTQFSFIKSSSGGFALKLGSPYYNDESHDFFYIPVTGQPPIKLSSVTNYAGIMQILSEEKIIYFPKANSDGVLNLFSFDLGR